MDIDEIDALLRLYDKKYYYRKYYGDRPKQKKYSWPKLGGTTAHLIFHHKAKRKPPPITLPRVRFMEFEFNEDWSTSSSPKEESQ
jgi:hypothetical protein